MQKLHIKGKASSRYVNDMHNLILFYFEIIFNLLKYKKHIIVDMTTFNSILNESK